MDESVSIGDYVVLRPEGRVFEVTDVEPEHVWLKSSLGGSHVKVKKEIIIVCQKNP